MNMETKFSRLVAMNDPVSESMHVAILGFSPSNLPEHATITASINKMKGDMASWNYVSMTFVQEQERQKVIARASKVWKGM